MARRAEPRAQPDVFETSPDCPARRLLRARIWPHQPAHSGLGPRDAPTAAAQVLTPASARSERNLRALATNPRRLIRATARRIGPALLAFALSPVAGGVAAVAQECAHPLTWRELHFEAHKLLLTARATISVAETPVSELAAVLRPVPAGVAVAPGGPCLTVVELKTDVPVGRDEVASAWFEPLSAAVLQVEKVASGHGSFQKKIRYTRDGYYEWRAAPRNRAEEAGGPESWSKRKTTRITAEVPAGSVVTDSYALLYLVSAARLDRRGAELHALMFAGDRLASVRLTAKGLSLRQIEVRESWPGGQRVRKERAMVREVVVSAVPIGADGSTDEVDLGFLGMKGDLTIYVETETAMPVELEGRADTIGRLRVSLSRAMLRAEPRGDKPAP